MRARHERIEIGILTTQERWDHSFRRPAAEQSIQKGGVYVPTAIALRHDQRFHQEHARERSRCGALLVAKMLMRARDSFHCGASLFAPAKISECRSSSTVVAVAAQQAVEFVGLPKPRFHWLMPRSILPRTEEQPAYSALLAAKQSAERRDLAVRDISAIRDTRRRRRRSATKDTSTVKTTKARMFLRPICRRSPIYERPRKDTRNASRSGLNIGGHVSSRRTQNVESC